MPPFWSVSEGMNIVDILYVYTDSSNFTRGADIVYLCLLYLGLLITYVALNLMDGHGQPALLYIVPFTLGKENTPLCPPTNFISSDSWARALNKTTVSTAGTFISLGKKRGELRNLWMKGQPPRVCTHAHHPLKDSADSASHVISS